MTEVLHSLPSCSSSSSSPFTPSHNTVALFQTRSIVEEEEEAVAGGCDEGKERDKERDQLSLLALLVALLRRSFWVACKTDRDSEFCGMEIGWPTNVRHVAHVTFDRFDGFLGLPVEFEIEMLRRAPSASATVFGVSTESMQLSYDSRGNSVPIILLLMQMHLYARGGLQAEGIFRINGENSQEEYVRDQLNRGVVPEGIGVHCLAGLIKAWFRELPTGVLDTLSHEQVLQCKSEEDCVALVRLLPPIEIALLEWAVNLMADVVQMEHLNKMNARNIAMVFAPNMTQMADPLTALMYAVQVIYFLKTLIERALREREDSPLDQAPIPYLEPSDEDGHQNHPLECRKDAATTNEKVEEAFVAEEPHLESACDSDQVENTSDEEYLSYSTSTEESDSVDSCETPKFQKVNNKTVGSVPDGPKIQVERKMSWNILGQSSDEDLKEPGKYEQQSVIQAIDSLDKNKVISNLSLINARRERFEAWR